MTFFILFSILGSCRIGRNGVALLFAPIGELLSHVLEQAMVVGIAGYVVGFMGVSGEIVEFFCRTVLVGFNQCLCSGVCFCLLHPGVPERQVMRAGRPAAGDVRVESVARLQVEYVPVR